MNNKLLIYQGGGYDGCMWEWNICTWNKEGKWTNIFSSGSMGFRNEKQALEFIKESHDDPYDLIDLDDQKQIDFVCDNYSLNVVAGLMKWFDENENYQPFYIVCRECKRKIFDPDNIEMIDYHGDGGIGIEVDSFICNECRSCGTCDICGYYYGGNYEFFENEHGELLCKNCREDSENEIKEMKKNTLKYEINPYDLNSGKRNITKPLTPKKSNPYSAGELRNRNKE